MTTTADRVPLVRRIAAAVVSALAVALIALAATLLLFFGGSAAGLGPVFTFFGVATLVVFVVMAVFALVGGYRTWYLRLLMGVFAGVIGSLVGFSTGIALAHAAPTGDVIGQSFASLIGPNLPFVVATIVGALTAGFVIWKRIIGPMDAPARRIALVRAPAATLAAGQLTHLARVPIDLELANEQWDEYVATLTNAGWNLVEVPTADDLPDSVFIEDALVVFGGTAVIGSPGLQARIGELAGAEQSAKALGLDILRIETPGTLDGGDVLKVGSTVYVARGGRTNADGIRQLRALISPLGYTVVAVPVSKALHLKSTVTALPDGTVIGYLPLVDDPTIFDRFLAVPEAEGVAVVVVSDDTVLMSSAAPASAALVADLGYRVLTVDISEFEKLEGCVTCLSVRIR